jgi:transcription antitermination factor NusG
LSYIQENINWYVVYTRPRWEKKIATILDNRGIENYLPLNKVLKQWSDRKKMVQEPLFKGYLFIKIVEKEKWDVKLVDGILNYVHWLGKPAVVKETEIENIKKFLQEFENVQVFDRTLNKGDEVIVQQGIMMNYKGIVLEVLNNKAIVNINSMGIKLTATFDLNKLQTV